MLYDDSWKLVPCKLSWTSVTSEGYSKRNGEFTHRTAWEETNGPIPEGVEVCHKCPARNCIELAHLFLGTHSENMLDAGEKRRAQGIKWKNQHTGKTHCCRGHEFTPENTVIYLSGRQCRKCQKIRSRKRRRV